MNTNIGQTYSALPIETISQINKPPEINIPNKRFDKSIYVTQFDVDIQWVNIFKNKSSKYIPSTVFSFKLDDAKTYGKKIMNLANEKGAIKSSIDPDKTSYPIIGYVIFELQFKSEPTINYIDKISRDQLAELLKSPPNFDITSFQPDWTSDRRNILHPTAYNKIVLKNIELIKTINIDEHTAFCLFNNINRLNLEDIQLIKELLSNGYGKSFIGGLRDPYYKKYLELKSLYLSNKHNH